MIDYELRGVPSSLCLEMHLLPLSEQDAKKILMVTTGDISLAVVNSLSFRLGDTPVMLLALPRDPAIRRAFEAVLEQCRQFHDATDRETFVENESDARRAERRGDLPQCCDTSLNTVPDERMVSLMRGIRESHEAFLLAMEDWVDR